MGIEKEENYFLGNSLFYYEPTVYQHISERESLFYDTSMGKTYRKDPPKEIKKKIKDFFRAFG